jgi:uridine kinase
MVRDNTHRGCNAENTIMNWGSVRRGEELNIFPYQEQADVVFNSAGLHELALLKVYAEPLLEEIQPDSPAYLEAVRLLRLLQYFIKLEDTSDIPNTAIVREFIGGSKIVH